MAKATAEEAAKTRQKIIDTALDITLNEGFEHVTLGTLAKRIGMSRSGINCHFPRKEHIAEVLKPIIVKTLIENLDFGSCSDFYESWVNAIDHDPHFVAAVRALGPIVPVGDGFGGLQNRIQCTDNDLVKQTIYKAIGYSVVHIAEQMSRKELSIIK
ncbi:TetR/AcrR family transcriptional regulator [Vibrio kasasachensis]|uniref:TetR/AcrR family transcriptional regulator n=1 Tax=Vibrio kasasachensis TaxID=2910248 RepID=UPI003D121B95